MKKISLKKAIANLEGLRGRSRKRTLDESDLFQALSEARLTDYGLRAGACVANRYGYPAQRMRLVAIRRRSGSYAVLADWGNAHKGTSDCPLGGRQSVWERTLRQAKTKLDPDLGWWIISGREVEKALAERRLQARREAEKSWPADDCPTGITITREDSLAAGNCTAETERVAAWWPAGTDSVLSQDLRAKILEREPELARFARRAVAAALARNARA